MISFHAKRTQSGLSLIEVLVALFLLMIGLMGVMGVQVFSQRQTSTSAQRSVVAQATATVIERMRGNLRGVICGNYVAGAPTPVGCVAGDAAQIQANQDLVDWRAALNLRMPNVVANVTGATSNALAVNVSWRERDATAVDPACPNGSPVELRCFNTTFLP
jgi:type IV pilus assembly protein PilV